jgi:hypothetical protein
MADKINMMMNSFLEEHKTSPRTSAQSNPKPVSRPVGTATPTQVKKSIPKEPEAEMDEDMESLLRAVSDDDIQSKKTPVSTKSKPASQYSKLDDDRKHDDLSSLLDEIDSTSPSATYTPMKLSADLTKNTTPSTPKASTTPITTPSTIRKKCETLYLGGTSSGKGVNLTSSDKK